MTSHARSTIVFVATACMAAAILTPPAAYAQAGSPLVARSTALSSGSGASQISGAAFHADDTPIARAKVQLRNVVSGVLSGATVANDTGQFAFLGMPPGIYIVELTSRGGHVLAVSDAVAVARAESATTFVRENGRPGPFKDLFGNAAIAISSVAATTGITAILPEAKRPVSPQK
jgi:hypothetical protein